MIYQHWSFTCYQKVLSTQQHAYSLKLPQQIIANEVINTRSSHKSQLWWNDRSKERKTNKINNTRVTVKTAKQTNKTRCAKNNHKSNLHVHLINWLTWSKNTTSKPRKLDNVLEVRLTNCCNILANFQMSLMK